MQGGRKKVADDQKILLFEKLPIPKAVMQLSVPTVLSSLVMVIYNLADTYFVGMMNDPVQNAAVTLAAPVLLAFLCLPFLCMDFIAVGVFQALGHGRKALVFAILRKILLEIPALYVLNFLFPLYGLPYAQFVAEFVLSIAAVVMLNRIFKSKGRPAEQKDTGEQESVN